MPNSITQGTSGVTEAGLTDDACPCTQESQAAGLLGKEVQDADSRVVASWGCRKSGQVSVAQNVPTERGCTRGGHTVSAPLFLITDSLCIYLLESPNHRERAT